MKSDQNNLIKTPFKNDSEPSLGFEIMSLSSLYRQFSRSFPVEQLQFHLLLVFTEGRGKHMVDFILYDWQPGVVLSIAKGQVQQFAPQLEGEGWLILFTEEFLLSVSATDMPALPETGAVNSCIQLPPTGIERVQAYLALMNEEYHKGPKDTYTARILRQLLMGLLFILERYQPATQPDASTYLQEFSRFRRLIQTQVTVTRQVEAYATELGYSAKKLNYICQAVVHQPAKEVITSSVVLQAKRLLAGTTQSSKEIAYALGFDEPTNFTKFFRRYVGQTPEAFRAAMR